MGKAVVGCPSWPGRRILATALAASLFIGNVHAQASQDPHEFNIPAGTLESAIGKFGEQSGIQIIYDDALIANKQALAVRGRLDLRNGLSQLLRGTGLTWGFVNDTTVVIKRAPPEPRRPVPPSAGSKADDREEEATELDPIVVTGTNIRGANNTSPVIILDREYIKSTGISTTARLLESLPQNFALTNQAAVNQPGITAGFQQGAAINLRGLGEGTTLVLLNGRRMPLSYGGSAADISALPLSAIEQVDVLTGGASAIYGSDAVGGVVNFILRRDLDGAVSNLRYGSAAGGLDEFRASHSLGRTWSTGNALVSVDYYHRDLLPTSKRDFVPDSVTLGSLYPEDNNASILLTGRQQFTDGVTGFSDVLYTDRKSMNRGGSVSSNSATDVDNPQLSVTAGLDLDLKADWRVSLSGSYAENDLGLKLSDDGFGADVFFDLSTLYKIRSAEVRADGPLFNFPGGPVRAALGVEWRKEAFGFESGLSISAPVVAQFDQQVSSVFGELNIPIVGKDNAQSWARRLELSLAARYDDYSSFGSSVDPQVGVMWEPTEGLRLRGSWGTSFRAPRLFDYDLSGNNSNLRSNDPDPGGSGGTSNVLEVRGADVDGFNAQESESLTFGVDFRPVAIPGLQLGVNYYRIEFTDRIAVPPAAAVILGNPASYGDLIVRDPTSAQVDAAVATGQLGLGFFLDGVLCVSPCQFDPGAVDVIVDRRSQNLSALDTSGLDLTAQYQFDLLDGQAQVDVTATHIFKLEQVVTADSIPFETVGTYSNPADWRYRVHGGWRRGPFAADVFVNHTAGYSDNRVSPAAPIDSYTTVDTRIAYEMEDRAGRWLSGVTVSLNVQNLFDQNPPRTAVLASFSDLGFDSANADPLGRFVALELEKRW